MNNANSTDRYAAMALRGTSPAKLRAKLATELAAGQVSPREFRVIEACIREFVAGR